MNTPEEREKLLKDLGWQVRVLAGREINFDSEGFFWDADDWSEELAELLARESGLEALTEVHWKVLRFIREYYLDNGRAPMNRHIRQGTGMSLAEVESLFPDGIRLGARRLAGLPNPKSC